MILPRRAVALSLPKGEGWLSCPKNSIRNGKIHPVPKNGETPECKNHHLAHFQPDSPRMDVDCSIISPLHAEEQIEQPTQEKKRADGVPIRSERCGEPHYCIHARPDASENGPDPIFGLRAYRPPINILSCGTRYCQSRYRKAFTDTRGIAWQAVTVYISARSSFISRNIACTSFHCGMGTAHCDRCPGISSPPEWMVACWAANQSVPCWETSRGVARSWAR